MYIYINCICVCVDVCVLCVCVCVFNLIVNWVWSLTVLPIRASRTEKNYLNYPIIIVFLCILP